ncbi:MAG: carbohydrate-binding family 9-like protein [Calditrichia bacterium]|nr:carbohydrate-binding family 9-like protein [Calditrichia bacterium]
MRHFISGLAMIIMSTTNWPQAQNLPPGEPQSAPLLVKKTAEFAIVGDGKNANWSRTEWVSIPQRKTFGDSFETRVKVLYSETGLYFLFHCQDQKLTASMEADFLDLWNEDVVEVFLWPDENFPAYFEYELSPLNYELPLLVPNNKGDFLGWLPWHYQGDRKILHATSVEGGEKKSGAEISAWIAEFFIPYKLLKPLGNLSPVSGTRWRANLYRCDYDRGQMAYWTWQPIEVRFHEYERFGTLLFE